MPSSRYYRYPILDAELKKKSRKKIFAGIFGLFILGALLWAVYFSPVFEIRNISINHPDKITPEDAAQIVNDLKLYSRIRFIYDLVPSLQKNLILISKKRLIQNLSTSFPEIRDLEVRKKFFHTLSIEFNMREQVGIWCATENCYYIDTDGVIFMPASESEGSLVMKIQDMKNPEADLGQTVLRSDLLKFLIGFRDKLSETEKVSVVFYKLNGEPALVEAVTGQGWSLYMEPAKAPDNLIKTVTAALNEAIKSNRSRLEYIDLRIPDRIFYKLK